MFKQDLITLDEATHKYTVKGLEHLRFSSATTFIGEFFEEFDAEGIATKLADSGSGKYASKTPEQILAGWDKIAERGTNVHAEIENWLYAWKNNDKLPDPKFDKSRHGINWLIENLEPHYKVYPEVKLFSVNLQLAGTVDLLIHEPKLDMWVMVDWKTNAKITTTAYRGKKGTHYATRLMPDCKLTKYALQMSLYSWMLEQYYDIKIHKRMLVQLRPKPTAYYPLGIKEYETEYHKYTIDKMVKYRLEKKAAGELFSPV